jgi:hypothetical protein
MRTCLVASDDLSTVRTHLVTSDDRSAVRTYLVAGDDRSHVRTTLVASDDRSAMRTGSCAEADVRSIWLTKWPKKRAYTSVEICHIRIGHRTGFSGGLAPRTTTHARTMCVLPANLKLLRSALSGFKVSAARPSFLSQLNHLNPGALPSQDGMA